MRRSIDRWCLSGALLTCLAVVHAGCGPLVGTAVANPRARGESTLLSLEQATVDAVNDVRRKHGLSRLAVNATLSHVARAHSEDMARRGYFDHRSPDGRDAPDRVRRAGLAFRRLGENLQKNLGTADPVRSAVQSWLGSRDHRKTMLVPEFVETGVGVSVAADGTFYFTQLFRTP